MSGFRFIPDADEVGIVFANSDTYRGHPRAFGRMLVTKPFILFALAAALIFYVADVGYYCSQSGPFLGLALSGATFALHGFLWWLQLAVIGVLCRGQGYAPIVPSIFLQVMPIVTLATFGKWWVGSHGHYAEAAAASWFFYVWLVTFAVVFEAIAASYVLPRGLDHLKSADR